MTADTRKERAALDRLADLLAEDILRTPDAEILAEFKATYGDPAKNATDMRALFEKTVLAANKSRLRAAQAAVAAAQIPASAAPTIDIADARERLRRILASGNSSAKLTLAARNESELSDADVLGTLEDLQELGALPPDDDGTDP